MGSRPVMRGRCDQYIRIEKVNSGSGYSGFAIWREGYEDNQLVDVFGDNTDPFFGNCKLRPR